MSVFITVISGHDKPQPPGCLLGMVLESQGEYDSQWAAICSIAPKIGCTPETLRVWVRQHERDTG
ncbi:hypothetical protein NOH43_25430, partial [Escherichia coli]|nr:hypothetical protein [Escherichia coli]